jgi:restriction endonuclease S subunit
MSDVPEGYKMSEVGVIPKEWEVETLGDIFTFGGGYSASWDQLSSEGYCYLHYGDIHKSVKSFIDVRAEYPNIPKLNILLKRISPKSLLHDGDIVFVDASEDDEGTSKHIVVVNNENITYISGLHTIVAKSKVAVLDNGYKRYCFQSRDIKKQFYFYAVGTKVSGISKTNIAKLKLPIPPLHEQQAIASALSDVDALIAALEQLITKKRNIKQGAMQQLLTGKKRLPGFSGEWEVKKLGEYSEFHKGKGLPKSEITTNGKYKCIHYGELFTTYNEEIKEVFSRTDKKDNFFLSRANDVLMPTSDVTPNGLATASCIKENEVILGGDVLVIRALADVLDGLFLSYSITQNKKQVFV